MKWLNDLGELKVTLWKFSLFEPKEWFGSKSIELLPPQEGVKIKF